LEQFTYGAGFAVSPSLRFVEITESAGSAEDEPII